MGSVWGWARVRDCECQSYDRTAADGVRGGGLPTAPLGMTNRDFGRACGYGQAPDAKRLP